MLNQNKCNRVDSQFSTEWIDAVGFDFDLQE